MFWHWNFARFRSKVSLSIAQNAEPSEDRRARVDDSEVDSAIDLGQHADKPLDGEALRAAVAKIGDTPFVDTEQVCGDDGRQIAYESQYLVGELLAERGDWRFDRIARHTGESALISAATVISGLLAGPRKRGSLAKFGGGGFRIFSSPSLAKFGERVRRNDPPRTPAKFGERLPRNGPLLASPHAPRILRPSLQGESSRASLNRSHRSVRPRDDGSRAE